MPKRPAGGAVSAVSSLLARRWAGGVVSVTAPAVRQRAATPRKGTVSGQAAAAAAPVPRLVRTTSVENVPWARTMTGRPVSFSARPATAFMVTSAAPLEAPAMVSPTHRLGRLTAVSARATPMMPSSPIAPAAILSPQRSSALPASSMAGRAPAPTKSRAKPSCPSLTWAWSCTRGTEAPHTPQNEPKAPKAANAETAKRRELITTPWTLTWRTRSDGDSHGHVDTTPAVTCIAASVTRRRAIVETCGWSCRWVLRRARSGTRHTGAAECGSSQGFAISAVTSSSNPLNRQSNASELVGGSPTGRWT